MLACSIDLASRTLAKTCKDDLKRAGHRHRGHDDPDAGWHQLGAGKRFGPPNLYELSLNARHFVHRLFIFTEQE
jgi:hypothetical protein